MTTQSPFGHDEQDETADVVRSLALSSAKLWEELFRRLHRVEVAQAELHQLVTHMQSALPPPIRESLASGEHHASPTLPPAPSYDATLGTASHLSPDEEQWAAPFAEVSSLSAEQAIPAAVGWSTAAPADLPAPPPSASPWDTVNAGVEQQGAARDLGLALAEHAATVAPEHLAFRPPPPPGSTMSESSPFAESVPPPPPGFTTAPSVEASGFAPPPPPGFAPAPVPDASGFAPPPPPGFAPAAPADASGFAPPPPPGFAPAPVPDASGFAPPPPPGYAPTWSPAGSVDAPVFASGADVAPSIPVGAFDAPPLPPPGFSFSGPSTAQTVPVDARGHDLQSAPPPPPGFFAATNLGAEHRSAAPTETSDPNGHRSSEWQDGTEGHPPPITPDFFARAGRRRH